MAKTLEITGNEQKAWEILGDTAHLYGDNGGDPDGNAWLPAETVDGDAAQRVIEAGLGQMVEVFYANDAAMMRELGFAGLAEDEELEENTVDRIKLAANDATAAWAHYGAYGAMDSHWVFVRR